MTAQKHYLHGVLCSIGCYLGTGDGKVHAFYHVGRIGHHLDVNLAGFALGHTHKRHRYGNLVLLCNVIAEVVGYDRVGRVVAVGVVERHRVYLTRIIQLIVLLATHSHHCGGSKSKCKYLVFHFYCLLL